MQIEEITVFEGVNIHLFSAVAAILGVEVAITYLLFSEKKNYSISAA